MKRYQGYGKLVTPFEELCTNVMNKEKEMTV